MGQNIQLILLRYLTVDESTRAITLIDLARKLTEKGFYEIAYRLELYCRTLEQQHGLISLDADIHLASQQQDINQNIVGFIKGLEKTGLEKTGLEKTPAILKHGTLTGQWGVGKTTALLQMEHLWSLPQLNTDAGNHNSWIPLFIELGKEQTGNVWDEIRSQLKKNAYWEEHRRGNRYPLACHALLSKIVSPANIRWLFNSPLYFLLDCIDLLSSDQKNKLEVELEALRDLYPESGFLLAFREGEGSEFDRLGNVRIRNLNEYQIQEFLKYKNTPISLDNLLGIHNKTICRYLSNPYILNIVCQLAFERKIENLNLQKLLETYINKISKVISPEKAQKIIDQWLPQKALQMRAKNSSLLKLQDSQELDLITRARRLGILRVQSDKYVIQFINKLFGDYFVAKRLFQLGRKRNIKDILRENISEIGDIYSWKDILKILAGFLNGNQIQIKSFIEFLDAECFKKNEEDVDKLNLVHECLLEITNARNLRSLQSHFKQVEKRIELNRKKYLKELNREKYVKLNVKITNSLGFLDPRINPDDPLKNMIDVPGTELLRSFKIGRFPVTNMEFAKFVEDGGYSTREYWVGNSWQWLHDNNIKYPRYWHNEQFNQPNYPVVGVSFYEAVAYCLWLREKYKEKYVFYLPTMQHWDLVAHGPNYIFDELLQKLEEVYKEKPQRQSLLQKWFPTVIMLQKQHFGHDDLREIPNRSYQQNEDEIDETKISKDLIAKVKEQMSPYQMQLEDEPVRPVGVFSPNEIGCFDLFGNVWHWCNTRSPEDVVNFQYGPYESAIVKGGYWGNPIWTVMGGWFDPFLRFHRLGFRICCTKSQRGMFHG
ncbi:MAG: SUMF1/EgtB/PvdO family nonheme iron enzyme [Xenococcaceae cyanobacterium MO_167.B27]|nr:SUMF1/EgtB/PvdO family nonheme iron enzyme [Xenococcaceae cyanobacterium MO_167.B27]